MLEDGEYNCAICENKILQSEESVNCDGSCLRKYHAKCLKFTTTFLKQFRENKNVLYNCDDCANNPIVSLNSTVKKMLSYLQIIDERMKRYDLELKCTNESVETCIDIIREKHKDIKDIIKKVTLPLNSEQNNKIISSKKWSEVVILKPKTIQKTETTKSELAKNVDPKSIGIRDVHDISKGGIAINCNTSDETKKLKDDIYEKIGDKYTVKITDSSKLKIKIIGMSDKLSEDDLVETIKAQNEFLKNRDVKVITIFENKKDRKFGAILEIEKEFYNELTNGEKLKIGWCRCRVVECVDIRRCFKCCGYNHKSRQCKNRLACLKCGGEHLMKDCGARNNVCVNCKVAVEKLNVRLDIFHPAYSTQCPVYKKKLENEKKRMKLKF